LDQPYLVPFSCGGALDAPQLAARGCAAAVSLDSRREATVQLFEGFSEMEMGGFGAKAERRRPQVLV